MVDVLEKRVRQLESRVYDPTKKDGDIECIPFLSKLNADLGNNLDRRDRIAPIMRRIQELELYLDPNFSEDKGIPTGVKLELILAQEQKIRETSDMLAKVEALKPSLNTEKLQHVAEAQSKIVSMSKIQVCHSHCALLANVCLLDQQFFSRLNRKRKHGI